METPPLNIILIDDEADGRAMISLLLQQLFPSLHVAAQADSAAAGLDLILGLKPDLVFLDVEMPDGTAFDVLSACQGSNTRFILVTAHHQYAIRALRASVLDYLLKPIDREEFRTAVDKALRQLRQPSSQDLSDLLLNMQKLFTIRKVRIPTLSGFLLVNADDIVRCEASGNYTVVYFTDSSKTVASRPLADYEAELKAYGFVRIHHKHLININQVLEYHKGKSGGYVTLLNREMLEVSARKKTDLIRLFEK